MQRHIRKFRTEEDGAVTVDWVVLTAGVIGLGIVAATIIVDATTPKAENLGQYLKDQSVGL